MTGRADYRRMLEERRCGWWRWFVSPGSRCDTRVKRPATVAATPGRGRSIWQRSDAVSSTPAAPSGSGYGRFAADALGTARHPPYHGAHQEASVAEAPVMSTRPAFQVACEDGVPGTMMSPGGSRRGSHRSYGRRRLLSPNNGRWQRPGVINDRRSLLRRPLPASVSTPAECRATGGTPVSGQRSQKAC